MTYEDRSTKLVGSHIWTFTVIFKPETSYPNFKNFVINLLSYRIL